MAYSLSKLQGAEPTLDYLVDFERKEYTNRKISKKPKSSFLDVENDLKIYNYGSKSVADDDDDVVLIDSYSNHTPKVSSFKVLLIFI